MAESTRSCPTSTAGTRAGGRLRIRIAATFLLALGLLGWGTYRWVRSGASTGKEADPPAVVVRTDNSATRPAILPTETALARDAIEAVPAPAPATDAEPTGSWARTLRDLKRLAAESPEQALAALSRLSDKHEQRSAAVAIFPIIAARAPSRATKAAWAFGLGRLAEQPGEERLLEQLAQRWAETDLAAALAWADSVPADEEDRRDHLLKGLASQLAKESPELAARFVSTRISAGTTIQADAAIETLQQWAARDYAGALRWVATLPSGFLRERALDELAKFDGLVPAASPAPAPARHARQG
jgi:hypothetical protein